MAPTRRQGKDRRLLMPSVHVSTVGTSESLQTGKAGEHLVCADLILHGYPAFLTDAGMPYDIVVALKNGKLLRVQVKSTSKPHAKYGYQFNLRRGVNDSRTMVGDVDVFAFVALDRMSVAYFRSEELVAWGGKKLIGSVDFGHRGQRNGGPPPVRTFEGCSKFPSEPKDRSVKICPGCGETYSSSTDFFRSDMTTTRSRNGVCRTCAKNWKSK